MIKTRIAVAAALLAVAGAASAGVSATAALTTDYDFRGVSQTDEEGAFQLGLNFDTGSGAYFGLWASNVDFAGMDAVWELDGTIGYAGGDAEKGVGYDIGATMYSYPSSSDFRDIYEVFAGVSSHGFSAKLWYAPDNYDKKSFYLEGNASIPVADGLSVDIHAGTSFGSYWSDGAGIYDDYSFGVTKKLGAIALNVKYVNSNDLQGPTGRNAWIATASLTLP